MNWVNFSLSTDLLWQNEMGSMNSEITRKNRWYWYYEDPLQSTTIYITGTHVSNLRPDIPFVSSAVVSSGTRDRIHRFYILFCGWHTFHILCQWERVTDVVLYQSMASLYWLISEQGVILVVATFYLPVLAVRWTVIPVISKESELWSRRDQTRCLILWPCLCSFQNYDIHWEVTQQWLTRSTFY